MKIELADPEIDLLIEALDSHAYWQRSDEHHRSSGYVDDVGADDARTREAIRACRRLEKRLHEARSR